MGEGQGGHAGEAQFRASEYRRQSPESERLRREEGLLRSVLGDPSSAGLVIDAGCGLGIHARYAARLGHRAVGADLASEPLREARRKDGGPSASWLRGRIDYLPLRSGSAKLILCLGNTLALLPSDVSIRRAAEEFHRVLAPGGRLLLQVLNYARLRGAGVRLLPPEVRGEGAEERIHLRVIDYVGPLHAEFQMLTVSRHVPGGEARVEAGPRRKVRTIERGVLIEILPSAGLEVSRILGGPGGEPFDEAASADLFILANRID